MSLIETRKLAKDYILARGEVAVPALRGIDMSVERGEYVAIMGPSGSGKSTLLNILGCLDKPSRGQYLLDRRDISTLDDDTLSEIRGCHLGFIFQSYDLIPHLSVLENISLPLYYQGWSEQAGHTRATELAGMVGLGNRLAHYPAELSGGQQQRVAIARALVNDPLVILADEPTGNLDRSTGREILRILDELNRAGRTLLVVTHDAEVAEHTRRVIHMLDGRIETDRDKKHNG
jgi:putative ABC transport system ATP-binding protein